MVEKYKHNIYHILMKKSCLYLAKKQMCILHSPLQRSYLNILGQLQCVHLVYLI